MSKILLRLDGIWPEIMALLEELMEGSSVVFMLSTGAPLRGLFEKNKSFILTSLLEFRLKESTDFPA
jgi:hypothetical protein